MVSFNLVMCSPSEPERSILTKREGFNKTDVVPGSSRRKIPQHQAFSGGRRSGRYRVVSIFSGERFHDRPVAQCGRRVSLCRIKNLTDRKELKGHKIP